MPRKSSSSRPVRLRTARTRETKTATLVAASPDPISPGLVGTVDWTADAQSEDNLKGPPGAEAKISLRDGRACLSCVGQHCSAAQLDAPPLICFVEGRVHSVGGKLASDPAAQILERWQRDGTGVLETIRGDWALALWDGGNETLFLARSPLSSFSLVFRIDGTKVNFAGHPATIMPTVALDRRAVVEHFQPPVLRSIKSTLWSGTKAVVPGTVVEFTRKGVSTSRFWKPSVGASSPLDNKTRADELRRILTASVVHACTGVDQVATQLSGGRDSSVVTALAAADLASRGGTVVALTAVPGADRIASTGLSDESGPAAQLAQRHENVDHRQVLSRQIRLCDTLDRLHRVHHEPLTNPIALAWWDEVLRTAAQSGSKRILTGEMGNQGLSAGGVAALGELLASGDMKAWLRLARRWRPSDWRTLANQSFGWLLPVALHRQVTHQRKATGPFYTQALRELDAANTTSDKRPSRSYRQRLAETVMTIDPAERLSTCVYGIERIDPTADPALIEFALSLTPAQLAGPPDERPIYDLAFADILPETILRPVGRGVQSSDYHKVIDAAELRDGLARYAENSLVADIVDIQAAQSVVSRWPRDGREAAREYAVIAGQLLPTLSIASFLWVHFPD